MTCIQCHQRINDTANYCENCGSKVVAAKKKDYQVGRTEVLDEFSTTKANDKGQALIFIGLLILCLTSFYYFVIRMLVKSMGDWSLYETFEPFSLIISGLGIAIALLLALGMNAGKKKTIAIVFASIYTIIQFYWLLDRLIPNDSAFSFLKF